MKLYLFLMGSKTGLNSLTEFTDTLVCSSSSSCDCAEEFLKTIAKLSEADASAGWCAMIEVTSSLAAAYLDEEPAREIFGLPGHLLALKTTGEVILMAFPSPT